MLFGLSIFSNGAQHANVGKAAAQYSSERGADLLVRGLRVCVQNSLGRQDYAAQAKSALGGSLVDKRLLNRMRLPGGAEPFQGSDLGLAHCAHRHHAGAHDLPAHDHGTGPALRHATAKPGSTQAKLVVENEQQRRIGVDFHGVGGAVHLEGDLLHKEILRLFASGCRYRNSGKCDATHGIGIKARIELFLLKEDQKRRGIIEMGKLDNKVAVITGGNSGIGLATAEEFVAQGAHVFITGRRQKELDQAVARIGRNVTAVQGDVSSLADLDRLYAQVEREKGRVDIVFANAGLGKPAAISDITDGSCHPDEGPSRLPGARRRDWTTGGCRQRRRIPGLGRQPLHSRN
jgi:3-oxoacyl-ACP reductase-like protein